MDHTCKCDHVLEFTDSDSESEPNTEMTERRKNRRTIPAKILHTDYEFQKASEKIQEATRAGDTKSLRRYLKRYANDIKKVSG